MTVSELAVHNKNYYDFLWQNSRLVGHDSWPVWAKLKTYVINSQAVLEIGPGLRPRIPIRGSYFIEVSDPAIKVLRRHGGRVYTPGDGLLKKSNHFEIICAFEVLEHLDDDEQMLKSMHASLKQNGKLIISVPAYMRHWTEWDRIVGHQKRYEPSELQRMLDVCGFRTIAYAEDRVCSGSYGSYFIQKIAMRLFLRYPKLSLKLEYYSLKLLCLFARHFRQLEWKNGNLDGEKIKSRGIFLICEKIS